MKKILAVSALSLVLGVSANALASAQQASGGYTGPSLEAVTTVAEALKMGDDTQVVLVGKIEKKLGDEKYVFSDATGTVNVEIDNDDWHGLTVNEKDTVEIRGEVDKGFMSFDIDVDTIVKK